MGKRKDNPRVIVEPRYRLAWVQLTTKEQESICETIVEQIKRHVNDVKDIYIEYDYVCEFCGYRWEEIDENNPCFCCDKAAEEWENKKASQK